MTDVFIENIVRKKNTPKIIALKILIVLAALFLSLVLFFLLIAFIGVLGQLTGFALLLIVGVLYGGFKLLTSLNVEFETSFTNGVFDVDKIVNRSRRKRLVSLRCKDIETFGRYKPAEHVGRSYKSRIIACDSELSEDVWYLTMHHSTLGYILVVFNAGDRLLNGFKPFLPKPIVYEVFQKGQQ